MNFSIKDLEYLEYAIKNKDRCRIVAYCTCALIEECINKDNDLWVNIYTFENCGDTLIMQLFNYIGCNANKG